MSSSASQPRRLQATLRTARSRAKERVKSAAARAGVAVHRLDADSRRYVGVSHYDGAPLPTGAEQALRRDHPDLLALEAAYDALEIPATTHTQWRRSFLDRNLSMAWFRGDNAYVWQFRLLRNAAHARTYLTLLDIESRDRLGLLKTLAEDGLFGAWPFTFGQRQPVSRDVLDSINEINYLDTHMGLSQIDDLKVLDIGAGYGRLAHRMSQALPNLTRYDCTDGVAVSTYLCDYYTRFRELDNVEVIPLTEHERIGEEYDLCVNIHSFSECSHEAIRWWLDRIAERRIEWLLIVPNYPPRLLSTEADGTRIDFHDDVVAAGYELTDQRSVYESDELRELIGLDLDFFLFRRR